jgi:radical SAM-linked protein
VIWLRVKFVKKGVLVYLSHLDIVRLLERLLRRADAPLVFSQGFTPRPKMLFSLALPLGVESMGEFMDVGLNMLADDTRLPKLQADLIALAHPAGTVIASRVLAEEEPTIDRAVVSGRYRVEGMLPGVYEAGGMELIVERYRKRESADEDEAAIFPKISELSYFGCPADNGWEVKLDFTGLASADGSLSISRMRRWLDSTGLSIDRVERLELLDADGETIK